MPARIHITKVGFDQAARHLNRLNQQLTRAHEEVTKASAEMLAEDMRKGIERQSPGGRRFKPLSPATLLARRAKGISSRKALIATGGLLKDIKARRVSSGKWHAGVSREYDQIARLQEEGYGPVAIRMTDKMRRYLFGVIFKGQPRRSSSGGRKGYVILKVPARPFVAPTAKAFQRSRRVQKKLNNVYYQSLRGLVDARV